VRRRFEGGICGVEFPGEWMPSSNLMSSVNAPEAMEESGEPGESAIVDKEHRFADKASEVPSAKSGCVYCCCCVVILLSLFLFPKLSSKMGSNKGVDGHVTIHTNLFYFFLLLSFSLKRLYFFPL
jgi:hypothetical protein